MKVCECVYGVAKQKFFLKQSQLCDFKSFLLSCWNTNFQGNAKLEKAPKFDKLKYSDSGVYGCVVSTGGLKKTQTFELIVEGECYLFFVLLNLFKNIERGLKCTIVYLTIFSFFWIWEYLLYYFDG